MKYYVDNSILKSDDLSLIAWNAISPIWDDLPFSRYKDLEKFMTELTEGQRGLIALDWCQKEIRNGGIYQLFVNSTGNLVPWAIAGFHLIGAFEYEIILSKATSMLGPDYPKSGSARRKALSSLSNTEKEEINNLENEFYKLINSKEFDLEKYRGNFVLNNPHQFIKYLNKG